MIDIFLVFHATMKIDLILVFHAISGGILCGSSHEHEKWSEIKSFYLLVYTFQGLFFYKVQGNYVNENAYYFEKFNVQAVFEELEIGSIETFLYHL